LRQDARRRFLQQRKAVERCDHDGDLGRHVRIIR
jgi:hypothetical protein